MEDQQKRTLSEEQRNELREAKERDKIKKLIFSLELSMELEKVQNLLNKPLNFDHIEMLVSNVSLILSEIPNIVNFFAGFIDEIEKDIDFKFSLENGVLLPIYFAKLSAVIKYCFSDDEEADELAWLREFYTSHKDDILDVYNYRLEKGDMVNIADDFQKSSLRPGEIELFPSIELEKREISTDDKMSLLFNVIEGAVNENFQSFYQIRKISSNPLYSSTLQMLQTSRRIDKRGKKNSGIQAKRAIYAQIQLKESAFTAWGKFIKRASENPTYIEVVNAYSMAFVENLRAKGKFPQNGNYPIDVGDLIGFPKYRFLELCNNNETPTQSQIDNINAVLRDIDHLEDEKGNRLIDLLHNYHDRSGRLISFYPSSIFKQWRGYIIGYIGRLQKACDGQPKKLTVLTYSLSNHLAYKQKYPFEMTKSEIKKAIPAIKPSYIDKNLGTVIKTLKRAGLWDIERLNTKPARYVFNKIENDTPQPILSKLLLD